MPLTVFVQIDAVTIAILLLNGSYNLNNDNNRINNNKHNNDDINNDKYSNDDKDNNDNNDRDVYQTNGNDHKSKKIIIVTTNTENPWIVSKSSLLRTLHRQRIKASSVI